METLDGRYRLGEEIARGAIGAVHQATDTRTGERVAVKLLRPEAAGEAELVTAFTAEATILAEMSHPSIVRFLDITSVDGRLAIVMEFVDGLDLRRRLHRDGPVPPGTAVDLVARAAEALAYLHGRGIAHGDVKPGNLLIPTDGGGVRLADFGAARRLADEPGSRPLLATAEYAAPEVVAGSRAHPPADMYALGIVLFESLSGRSPFRGGTPSQVLTRHGNCAPVPPPGLPALLWPLIEACLAVRPADRPGAPEMAARLSVLRGELDGLPALAPWTPDQITWWPRATAATTAAATVSWVPLRAAPVSPASAYASRMVAIPVAAVSDPDPVGVGVRVGVSTPRGAVASRAAAPQSGYVRTGRVPAGVPGGPVDTGATARGGVPGGAAGAAGPARIGGTGDPVGVPVSPRRMSRAWAFGAVLVGAAVAAVLAAVALAAVFALSGVDPGGRSDATAGASTGAEPTPDPTPDPTPGASGTPDGGLVPIPDPSGSGPVRGGGSEPDTDDESPDTQERATLAPTPGPALGSPVPRRDPGGGLPGIGDPLPAVPGR